MSETRTQHWRLESDEGKKIRGLLLTVQGQDEAGLREIEEVAARHGIVLTRVDDLELNEER
jgi:hypothetical protein